MFGIGTIPLRSFFGIALLTVPWIAASAGCHRDARTIAAVQLEHEGGVRLVYAVDKTRLHPGQQVDVQRLTDAVARRLGADSHANRIVTAGPGQGVTVLIIGNDADEVTMVRKLLASQGMLEFRIAADPLTDEQLATLAQSNPQAARTKDEDASRENEFHVDLIKLAEEDPAEALVLGGNEQARWIPVDAADQSAAAKDPNLVTRRRADGTLEKLVIIGQERFRWVNNPKLTSGPHAGELAVLTDRDCVSRIGPGSVNQLLVLINPIYVDGSQINYAHSGIGMEGPHVSFSLNQEGARKMAALTRNNLPKQGRMRRLAILLDNNVLTAPTLHSTISDSGQISGNYTKDEAEWLAMILRSGALPTPLRKQPIREERLPPGSTL